MLRSTRCCTCNPTLRSTLARAAPAPGSSRSCRLQPRERPRAGRELVDREAETLEHRDVEIAQGRRVLRIEGQVLAVLESAADYEDRQILDRVAAPVSEIAAEKKRRPVEQAHALFLRVPELRQEIPEHLHRLHF